MTRFGIRSDRWRKLLSPRLLPLLIVALGSLLTVLDPAWVQGLRNNLFDQYQRWMPRAVQAAPVTVVDIDEESLRRLGQWPWPRTRVAEMVQRMRDAGAAAIGFDVVFAEPDRTSPKAMAALWRERPGSTAAGASGQPDWSSLLAPLPDHDEVLAQAVAGGKVVLGFTLGPADKLAATAQTALARPAAYVQKGPSVLPFLYGFASAVPSLLPLQQAAAGNGVLTFVPDRDGVVRRVPLVVRYREDAVPSFSAELLRVAQGAQHSVLTSATTLGGGSAGLQELRIGQVVIPTTPQGEAWVHYTAQPAVPHLPAWKLLSGQLPAGGLKDQILLVGSSAQGLMDLRVSPMGQIIPGVDVHAQALEQMLAGHLLVRPSWADGVEWLLMVVVGFAVGLLALNARSVLAASLSLMMMASMFSLGWLAFAQFQLLLNPLTPSLVVLASFMVCSLVHHFRSERQQRWLTEAFARYVSPNKVAYLVKHPEGLQLGGTRQTCSFIFTDLQGFTSLMEHMDPGAAVSALNGYLDGMVAIAFRHEGTLDRIMGDAVAVVFSAPVRQDDHRQRAFHCALEMHEFARRYAQDLRAKGLSFGDTRIGVHSGEVIVGNFGGSHMFDYRALGDPVNTAARLESVNKQLGTRICMSEAVYVGCPDAVARPIGRLVLKGKTQPLMVYEPVVTATESARVPLADYKEAYALLVAQRLNGLDPQDALQAFSRLAELYPADPLVRLHLQRLRAGETGDELVMAFK